MVRKKKYFLFVKAKKNVIIKVNVQNQIKTRIKKIGYFHLSLIFDDFLIDSLKNFWVKSPRF